MPGQMAHKTSYISRIVTHYGLQPADVAEPKTGYRNRSYRITLANAQLANLIIYKSEPGMLARIRRANLVSNFLAAQGLPARPSFDPRILRISTNPARYAALYDYLPGETIPWEAYTMEHLKALGATMGHMHAALADIKKPGLPNVADEYLAILARLRRYFADPGIKLAITDKLGLSLDPQTLSCYEHILRASAKLPSQPLHMDFVRGNILFNEQADITGILDFEKTALGHPLFDIARTLAFLLVDCKYKTAPQIRKYFLHSGYRKRGDSTIPKIRVGESTLLEELVTLFLLHDFYKFLRHNPYEFLHENEHFVRTRDLLLARGVISIPNLASPLRAT